MTMIRPADELLLELEELVEELEEVEDELSDDGYAEEEDFTEEELEEEE